MNRIMLRFRPIAPKPPGGDSISDAAAEKEKRTSEFKRTKRKYVRVRCRQSKSKKISLEEGDKTSSSQPKSGVVTLQLLPEKRSDQNDDDNNNDDNIITVQNKVEEEIKWSLNHHEFTLAADLTAGGGSLTVRSAIETWIIVESVTDTYIDHSGLGLGFSDTEKIMSSLQADTCPGFVSDTNNNVVWVNDAYKEMMAVDQGVVRVRLVVKENLPYFNPSFACRVRVIQQSRYGQKWNNRIVPCDVWKMEFIQRFAWKLDVNTALGLSIN